jgi:ABC-type nitrate/sulfonate/bicarbonate transport system permease component
MHPRDPEWTLVRWVASRPWAVVVVLLTGWEIGGRLLGSPLLFPWPTHVALKSLPSLALFGGALQPEWRGALVGVTVNLAITSWRIALGLLLGVSLGCIVGIAAFALGRRCSGEPVALVLLRCLPLFGLIPLFVLWFGGRESGVWAYIGFASAVVVATGVHQAIANVPRDWLLQARLLGATRLQLFATVVMPAVVPEIKSTARNALGLSWAFSLGAEYAGGADGLGHLVYLSYTYADMGKIVALACVYCVSGLTVFWIWTKCVERWGTWTYDGHMEGKA